MGFKRGTFEQLIKAKLAKQNMMLFAIDATRMQAIWSYYTSVYYTMYNISRIPTVRE